MTREKSHMAWENPAKNISLLNWSCSQVPCFGERHHQFPIWHVLSLSGILALSFFKSDQGACLSCLLVCLFLRQGLAVLPRLILNWGPLALGSWMLRLEARTSLTLPLLLMLLHLEHPKFL